MYQVLPIFHNQLTHILSKSWPYFSHLNLGKPWNIIQLFVFPTFLSPNSVLSPYFFILLNSKFLLELTSQQNSKNCWCCNIFSFLSFYFFPSYLRFFSQLSPFLFSISGTKKSYNVKTLYLIHHTLGFTIILYPVNSTIFITIPIYYNLNPENKRDKRQFRTKFCSRIAG